MKSWVISITAVSLLSLISSSNATEFPASFLSIDCNKCPKSTQVAQFMQVSGDSQTLCFEGLVSPQGVTSACSRSMLSLVIGAGRFTAAAPFCLWQEATNDIANRMTPETLMNNNMHRRQIKGQL